MEAFIDGGGYGALTGANLAQLYHTKSYDHFGPFAASYVNNSTLLIFIYNEQFRCRHLQTPSGKRDGVWRWEVHTETENVTSTDGGVGPQTST